jgi:hypothetical protein
MVRRRSPACVGPGMPWRRQCSSGLVRSETAIGFRPNFDDSMGERERGRGAVAVAVSEDAGRTKKKR